MTQKEQIRTEIERRLNEAIGDAQPKPILRAELRELLNFVDSLPEEKPSKDLEEAAEKYCRDSYNKVILPNIDGPTTEYEGSVKDAFKAGAKWMAEQMMKDAVEAPLYRDGDFLAIDLDMEKLGYTEDDKVKIIIVKEEDEQ